MRTRAKPTYAGHEYQYRAQMKAIKDVCKELNVTPYFPDYHSDNDPNTVLIYFNADAEYNRALEKANAPFTPRSDEYRPYFFCFQNTDINGRYDQNFANNGSIDLRPLDGEKRIHGAIRYWCYTTLQNRYIRDSGGVLALRESDDYNNDLNRARIEAFRDLHGEVYLGQVNYYDDQRKKVASGEIPALQKWDGSKIYNFGCAFAVPHFDEELNEMIRKWNTGGDAASVKLVKQIVDRVEKLHGFNMLWY